MGIWLSERGRVSDEMADILSDAFERIGDLRYQMDPEPEFTIVDLADAIEYVTYGFLIVEVNPKLQEVIDHSIVGKEPNLIVRSDNNFRNGCRNGQDNPPTASTLKVSEIDSIDFRNLPNRGDVKWLSQWQKERDFFAQKEASDENINGNASI